MKSIALYTVILGNYDHGIPYDNPLQRLPFLSAAYFVCDDTVQCKTASSSGWTVIQLPKVEKPKQAQRSLKILQHLHPQLQFLNAYDIVIYHDGNNSPVNNHALLKHISLMDNCDLVCFDHPHRSKCYEEVCEIVKLGLVHAHAYDKILQIYKENGFTDDIGLTDTRLLIRNIKSIKVKEFNEHWLQYLSTHDIWRDQSFFDFCIWKTGIRFTRLKNIEFPFRVTKTHLDPYRVRSVR